MERDFWLSSWNENQIGFHQRNYNRLLRKYWDSLDLQRGSEVLVPLCGKSKDMLWLAQAGHRVLGNELSELAVESFFSENDMEEANALNSTLGTRQFGAFKIVIGDFFDLSADDANNVAAVYDRASLVALPPDVRKKYASHLRSILTSGCQVLLISLEYEKGSIEPPPFTVLSDEIDELFGKWCNIKHLETLPGNIKGKEGFESAYRIEVR